jgi:hypothetical protein
MACTAILINDTMHYYMQETLVAFFGGSIVQQCRRSYLYKEETMGEHMVFTFIKMIPLMFIYLMNLFLKRNSLEVYQAKD